MVDDLTDRVEAVVAAYLAHHPDAAGGARIRAAYDLAAEAHAPQVRESGEPYIVHPLAVAFTVADLGMDLDTVLAALCHDVVEDTDVRLEELEERVGPAAARLVDGVTKLDRVAHASRTDSSAANLRKLLLAATTDPRVLVLKIADRMHNVATLAPLAPGKRERVARETMEVFAPIAHRMGLNEAAAELEDAAFAALQPDLFAEISARMDAVAPRRDEAVDRIREAATRALEAAHIKATVTGRQKHVYSTWRKTIVRKQSFDDIADLIGVRVIVADPTTCYTALGVLHNEFTPVPGRFRDYVAQPRFGHYQSLHTTVAVDGVLTEVQIRSWAMHAAAEQGIAAHWRYKDGADLPAGTDLKPSAPDLPWLHELVESGFVAQSTPEEFLDGLRRDLGADEVVVFTPQGEPLTLPEGATALDAAYAVHTEVGNRCVAAQVNGVTVPRSCALRPGDQFHIVTGSAAQPTHAWLDEVVTGRARSAIRSVLHERERAETRLAAAQALDVALRHAGLGRGCLELVDLSEIASGLGYGSAESLLDAFGARPELADMTAARVREVLRTDGGPALVAASSPSVPVADTAMVVDGHDDLVVSRAGCCSVGPARDAVAVPQGGGVVTVHAIECLELAQTDGPLYDVTLTSRSLRCCSRFLVDALHRRTLLADIAAAALEVGADVVELGLRTSSTHTSHVELTAAAADDDVLWRLQSRLRGVDGAYRVAQVEADADAAPDAAAVAGHRGSAHR